ncbi:MAG: hypothetical protein KIS82_04250, partial [Ferruginibacter sp.]|nr:hypothetical protein [Ferruginibacter sp.]
ESSVIKESENFGMAVARFNQELRSQLNGLVMHGSPKESEFRSYFTVSIPFWQKILLTAFASLGYILNAPLYLPLRKISLQRAAPFEHYDSVLIGLLMILYPFYLIVIFLGLWRFLGVLPALCITLLFPTCAWCFVRIKKQS